MKIKMIVSMAGQQESFPAGTVRDIEDAMGQHLINVGFAIEVKEPKKEIKKDAKVSNKDTTSKRTSKRSGGKKSTKK